MSCADVQTIQAGNGSKTQFSFDFPYLFKSEVQVSFWNVTTKEWDVIAQTDATYPWQLTDANPTIVEFTGTAPPSPATPVNPDEPTVDNVRIRRVTDINNIRALFNPGSAIRSDDLNKNFEQLRYAIQEGNCQEVPAEIYDFLRDYYWNTFSDVIYSTADWTSADNKIATTAAIDGQTALNFDTLVQTDTPSGSDWRVGKTWLQNNADLTLSIWNGSAWTGVASGGTFTTQPKVVYVDKSSGDDANDGHRISRPKATIKAAVEQVNADATYGDGSVIVVAPGVYEEVAPIDITRKDVSIVGTTYRGCVVHPTVATEENVLFRVNSGSYIQNITFTGMKASGVRGAAGSVDPDGTYGLPPSQGWNVAFYPNAMIYKSPYIQNCINFSDSEIDNSALNPNTPAGGSAGDTDSEPTGGGILVDGSAVHSNSPLRSMVCDSYSQVCLDGPGILVTNNGYCQATSTFAFFAHYHLKCLNGGQANISGSTTDFGRYGLIADGKSTSAIFTATTTANAADGATSFTIGAPVAGVNWYGSATRPQNNMVVEIGGNTYPVLSASANGSGWDVTILRPNPADKSENLGLDGAVSSGASVSFYLRSMIASSNHTMEYCGSGTNYSALPENGGVPVEAAQVVERNDGKVWAAITDQSGKFKLGDFFVVDQQNSTITLTTGTIPLDLSELTIAPNGDAQLNTNLDLNGNHIVDSTGSVSINDTLTMNLNKITNVGEPSSAQDAATKNYVDSYAVTIADIGSSVQAYDAGLAYLDSLNFTDEATFKQSLNLEIGTDTQAYDAGLNYLAGLTFTDEATFKAAVNLETGIDVQAYAASLNYLAGLTFTDEASFKAAVNLEIGTDVQAHDADTAKTDVAQTFTAGQRGSVTALTDASTIVLDFNDSNYFSVTLGNISPRTLDNPSNAVAGQSGAIFITQDATGGRTLSYGGNWSWSDGNAPTLSLNPNAVDVLIYMVLSPTSIVGHVMKNVQ